MSILLVHSGNASRRSQLSHIQSHARSRGERLLLLMNGPSWEAEYVDSIWSADTSDVSEVLDRVQEIVDVETEDLRAVVPFSEHSVPAAAAVAQMLGLPALPLSVAELARDKYAMRQAFDGAGVTQPTYGLAGSLDEAVREAERIGFPLILKPLIGGGSKHIRRVENGTELTRWFDELRQKAWEDLAYDPLNKRLEDKYGQVFVLEQYVEGIEISVESVVSDGVTAVIAIHDKPLPMEGPTFEEYFYSTPSRLPDETQRRVCEVTSAVHEAVGITMGATHTEFRIPDSGAPMVIEIAARLGGGPLYQSVLRTTGVDMVGAAIDCAMGVRPRLQRSYTGLTAGFCQFFASAAGEISRINGVTAALMHPDVKELAVYPGVGDRVDVPPFVFQGFGHALFTGVSHESLCETYDFLQRTVTLSLVP